MIRGKLLVSIAVRLMLISVIACADTSLQKPTVAPTPIITPAPTVRADAYPKNGAIAEAKRLTGQDDLREEARQFGLSLITTNDRNAYEQLRDRLFNNAALVSALKTTRNEDIAIWPEYKFKVGTTGVDINVNASDDEIIKFLKDSLPEAKANKTAYEQAKKEASQFGLSLMLFEYDEYKQIRERLFANEKLASALKAAAREDISVILDREFSVSAKYIFINVNATDEKIIEFLLGK